MKTMEEIDIWYENQMNQAKLEGALEEKQRQQKMIALNMIQENISLEVIARITGLTIDRLQQLQSEQENNRSN